MMGNKYRNLILVILLGVVSVSYGQWDYSYDMYGDKMEQTEADKGQSKWNLSYAQKREVASSSIGGEDLPADPGVVPMSDGYGAVLFVAGILTLLRKRKRA